MESISTPCCAVRAIPEIKTEEGDGVVKSLVCKVCPRASVDTLAFLWNGPARGPWTQSLASA